MKSLAVIGTGIAGMASAYLLRERFDITVYEKNAYIGGHTNTIAVPEGGKSLPIDTGFMVYNEKTYPNLVRFFRALSIVSKETSMSFSVSGDDPRTETKFSDLGGFFPARSSYFDLDRYRLLVGMRQLFIHAARFLKSDALPAMTLSEFVRINAIEPIVVDRFLVPMAAAIWSTPSQRTLDYPAHTLFRFLTNHGMLGFSDQLSWRTLVGGSQQYKDKIIAAIGGRVQILCGVKRLRRHGAGVEVTDVFGASKHFDAAIVATHADQALSLLDGPTELEARTLGKFKYNVNPVMLHSDSSVMPRSRKVWASWNYRYAVREGENSGSTHYWMNSLQDVSQSNNYFVSVDYDGPIDEASVKWRSTYEHPRFDEAAIRAQAELPTLNQTGPIYYCGSYFRYGFHEDALTSALDVCRQLNDGKDPLA